MLRIEVDTGIHALICPGNESPSRRIIVSEQAEASIAAVVPCRSLHVLRTGEKHVLPVQQEEVRTLKHPPDRFPELTVAQKSPDKVPVQGISALIQQKHGIPTVPGLGCAQQAIGSICLLPCLRIPEVRRGDLRRQIPLRENGIISRLLVVPAIACCHTLRLDAPVAHAGVDQLLPSIRQRQGTAREAPLPVTVCIRCQRCRQI